MRTFLDVVFYLTISCLAGIGLSVVFQKAFEAQAGSHIYGSIERVETKDRAMLILMKDGRVLGYDLDNVTNLQITIKGEE